MTEVLLRPLQGLNKMLVPLLPGAIAFAEVRRERIALSTAKGVHVAPLSLVLLLSVARKPGRSKPGRRIVRKVVFIQGGFAMKLYPGLLKPGLRAAD